MRPGRFPRLRPADSRGLTFLILQTHLKVIGRAHIESSKSRQLSLFGKILKKYENNDILETEISEFLEIFSEINLK